MSAWLCDEDHIAVLACALDGTNWSPASDPTNARSIAATLAAENVRSLRYRYEDRADGYWPGMDDYPGDCAEAAEHMWPDGWRKFSPVALLKSLHCYEYQACEHEDWERSPAAKMCRQLASHLITRLPGYGDAEWGAPKEEA